MTNFSIGEAWSQGMAFLSAHFRMTLLFVTAGVLIPIILQMALLGGTMETLFTPERMMANPNDPFAMFAGLGAAFFLVIIVGSIIQSASYFASWRHGLSGGQEEPAGAIVYGLGASALWLVAQLVLIVVMVLVIALPIGLIAGFGAASGGSPMLIGVAALILVPLLLLFILWISARLICVGPAMADARSMNPLFGLSQSWQMTRASQWPIVGYLVVLFIAAMVVLTVISLIAGIGAAGAMAAGGQDSAGFMIVTIISGVLLGIPMALAYVAIPAGIYRTLVPNDAGDVFA